jgi:hypothetical protein
MRIQPTSFRFTDDELALLDAWADFLHSQGSGPKSRTAVVRRLLRKMTPPTNAGEKAARVRVLHRQLFGGG